MTRLRATTAAVIAVTSVLLLKPATATAFDVYLRINGIDGESTDKQHAGWIDVLGVGEGITVPPATGPSGAQPAMFSEVSVVKMVDKATPLLFLAAAGGQHLATATLEFVYTNPRVTFFTIKLSDAIIASLRTNATTNNGSARPTESLTLRFSKIEWTYVPLDATGQPGQPITGGWDVGANKPT